MMPTATHVRPARRVHGRVEVPGDKSISHRYALLAALADGESTIHSFAPGADCAATLACLRALKVDVVERRSAPSGAGASLRSVHITGRGVRGLAQPLRALDAQNSGTTLRLLAGILAAHPMSVRLGGDRSLERRPMGRVIEPLERMGARIESRGGCPPLTVHGCALQGISFSAEVPSAQVKSAVLLAGLQASGRTSVVEPVATRNHTELALRTFGVDLDVSDRTVSLEGGQRLRGTTLQVPGDISSAAFLAAAAAALPGSTVEVVNVGLNSTRTAVLEALRRFGAEVDVTLEGGSAGEPVGCVRVRHNELRAVVLSPADVPSLIDELPVLAALATHGGELRVTGAAELRVKESDRIAALVTGLRALGADADELPDGFHVRGARRLAGGTADAVGDHRLAMAFAIAALGAERPSVVLGTEAAAVSYPGFFTVLEALCDQG